MTFLKSALVKGALLAAVTTGSFVAVTSASADVVCNRAGECWHVHNRIDYPANLGMAFHDEAWATAHQHGRWHWRGDRDDRGYYRNGAWVTF